MDSFSGAIMQDTTMHEIKLTEKLQDLTMSNKTFSWTD